MKGKQERRNRNQDNGIHDLKIRVDKLERKCDRVERDSSKKSARSFQRPKKLPHSGAMTENCRDACNQTLDGGYSGPTIVKKRNMPSTVSGLVRRVKRGAIGEDCIDMTITADFSGVMAMTVNLSSVGYDDENEILISNNGAVTIPSGAVIQTVVGTGTTTPAGGATPNIGRSRPPQRGWALAFLRHFSVSAVMNYKQPLNREGALQVGWTKNTIDGSGASISFASLMSRPGNRSYSAQMLQKRSNFEFYLSPETYGVNDAVGTDGQPAFKAAAGSGGLRGYFYILGDGFNPGDQILLKIKTTVHYSGYRLKGPVAVISDKLAVSCVVECLLSLLQDTTTLHKGQRSKLLNDLMVVAGSTLKRAFPQYFGTFKAVEGAASKIIGWWNQ